MRVNRRTVLSGGAALAVLGGPAAEAVAADPKSWDWVRAQFILDRRIRNFTAWFMAPHPASVRAAIAEYREMLDVHPHTFHLPEEDFARSQVVREALAGYLGARPEDIVLTDSTTMGLGLVYQGLRLNPGDEVLTTEHDFYPTHDTLRMRAEADGITVRRVRLYDDPARASTDEIVTRLRAAITPRTKALALTWVHSGTGVMLPVKQITAMVAALPNRPLVCLDGVHGVGVEDTTVDELGCDFLVSGTHKWMFGPRGTGFVWGRADAWPRVRPLYTGFSDAGFIGWLTGQPPVGTPADLLTPGGFHSYENRWALARAVEFQQAIGRIRVTARTKSQAARLKDGLAGLRNVRVVTPRDPRLSAGLVCLSVQGLDSTTVTRRLLADHRILVSASPYRESFVRIGPSIVTTPHDVDQVVKAIATLR